jgi:hypothetical protein
MEDTMRKTLKTLLAAVAVCGIMSGATAVASEPDRDCSEVVRMDARVVQSNDVYVQIAWLIELGNNCDGSFEFDIIGQFYDENGFTIDTFHMYNATISERETKVFSDTILVNPDVASEIDGFRFRVPNSEVR